MPFEGDEVDSALLEAVIDRSDCETTDEAVARSLHLYLAMDNPEECIDAVKIESLVDGRFAAD